jgi:predicted component of type VI protein secretion system
MTEHSEQHKQLIIQREIRKVEDDLVVAIQEALDEAKYGDLEESQFRNLVRVADTTDSKEVIKNFLRYQMGRDKKWGRGKDSLAEKIIQDINTKLADKVKLIMREAKVSDEEPIEKTITLELIRRYLGYGARHLTYKRKAQS